ncbi:NADH-quinone oxidoreductase subunit C [Streptomyces sp. NPDC057245]|uniref:NADH-quinone oxidoreductase subunit C n=1 Tax=Streptomyces sp. NPDC057245 TaxID=3346065 RepID=UPI003640F610
MTAAGWLPAGTEELFGAPATAEEAYGLLTVDVPPASWIPALETARDRLGCTYFDWLSAVDEPGTGFRVAAHVVALGPVRRLLLRTTVPHDAPLLPTAVAVYAGAAWHERETHEMFGIVFEDHPALDHLLLPEGFEGHPLRKDFVLAARVAKAWPGAKEPGESEHGGPRRRQMLPPGVPDPNEWGPLKGQLPPAPARPARGAGRAAGERPTRAAGDRPPRRTRTAAEGSATQTASGTETPATPRRSRTAAEGSAGQAPRPGETPATPATPGTPSSPSTPAPRRTRSASQGSASQRSTADPTDEPGTGSGDGPAAAPPAGPRRARSASQGSASQRAAASSAGEADAEPSPSPSRSSDAPWHHARPAFDEPTATTEVSGTTGATGTTGADESPKGAAPGPSEEPETPGEPEPGDDPEARGRSESGDKPEARDEPEPGDGPEARDEPEAPRNPPPHPSGGTQ